MDRRAFITLIEQAEALPEAHGDGLTINSSRANYAFQLAIQDAKALYDGRVSTITYGGTELDIDAYMPIFAQHIAKFTD